MLLGLGQEKVLGTPPLLPVKPWTGERIEQPDLNKWEVWRLLMELEEGSLVMI